MNQEELRKLLKQRLLFEGDIVCLSAPGLPQPLQAKVVGFPHPSISYEEKYFPSILAFAKNFGKFKKKNINITVNDKSLLELTKNKSLASERKKENLKKRNELKSKQNEIEDLLKQSDDSELQNELQRLELMKSGLQQEAASLRELVELKKKQPPAENKEIRDNLLGEAESKVDVLLKLTKLKEEEEDEDFVELQRKLEGKVSTLRERMLLAASSFLQELERLQRHMETDVETLQQKLTERRGTEQEKMRREEKAKDMIFFENELASIHKRLEVSLETPKKDTENEEALRKAIKESKAKLLIFQQEKRKLEEELKEAQSTGTTTSSRWKRRSHELDSLRKVLTEEEQERKTLTTQLNELKETVKSLEEKKAKEGATEILPSGSALDVPKGDEASRRFVSEKALEISWYDLRVLRRVGGGGFAEVYEGVFHGERVAIKKLISQSHDQDARKELEKEVQIMANSHSGYIVKLYGFSLHPPHMCMVMEFFPRGSLAYILWDKNSPVSWNRRWSFARDAALGLNYLHNRNPPILHRDIKAGNYLITSSWRLKLTDFGCSTFKGAEEKAKAEGEKENFIGGTFQWTAPEVLSGDAYNEKADVYSFGMVLYEIASRKQPWDEYSSPDEQYRVRQWVGEGKRPSIPYDTPEDFKVMMQSAWEHDVYRRLPISSILRVFEKKGLLTDDGGDESGQSWFEEKAKIQEEIEQVKQAKEDAEVRTTDAEKEQEKEKRKRSDYEQKLVDVEGKYEAEKNATKRLERDKEDAERRYNLEKQKATEAIKRMEEVEKKHTKVKKQSEKFSKAKDDADQQIEEITKKWEQEKKKRMDLQRELANQNG